MKKQQEDDWDCGGCGKVHCPYCNTYPQERAKILRLVFICLGLIGAGILIWFLFLR